MGLFLSCGGKLGVPLEWRLFELPKEFQVLFRVCLKTNRDIERIAASADGPPRNDVGSAVRLCVSPCHCEAGLSQNDYRVVMRGSPS